MFPFRPSRLPSTVADPGAAAVPVRGSAAVYWLALALTVAIVGLFLLNNRQYLFHTEIYESSDWAADSLFVGDAEHSVLLHGQYSRWSFYHPGPVLFYVYALGEVVFFKLLHAVPTRYNGQVIAICIAETFFFSFAVAVFARRLGKERGGYTFFLPMALLFAIWHYGTALNGNAFLETWPACPPILPFLCLVVATASTASGGGRELPLIALAGGWLVHNHVAQPLFVVPLSLLAYAGLLVTCHRQQPDGSRRGLGAALTGPWRAFPRAHLLAAGILALFILPLLIDSFHGSHSNLSQIISHLHRHQEPPKKFSRSLCYFLTFGSYAPYDATLPYFGRYTTGGMLAFVLLHWRAYLCWIVALVAAPILFALAHRNLAATKPPEPTEVARNSSSFIPWFYFMASLAFALTLVWGMKQDGEMYYFNAYFNYSIFYCLALVLAAALAAFWASLTAVPGLAPARSAIGLALCLGVAAAAVNGADHFKVLTLDLAPDRAGAKVEREAAAATLPPGSTCYLDCDPWEVWPTAIAVVLQLDRLGCNVRVNDNWGIMFGQKRTFGYGPINLSQPIVHWRILPIARDPAQLGRWPVVGGCGIEVQKLVDLDPATANIRFASDGNSSDYAWFGWSPTVGDWKLTEQRYALLQFRPLAMPENTVGGVDMLINAWSYTAAEEASVQRMEIVFNGVTLPTVRLPIEAETAEVVRVHLDAQLWRDAVARGSAEMLFRFPDAVSPYDLGLNDDRGLRGGGFRTIEFRSAEQPPDL